MREKKRYEQLSREANANRQTSQENVTSWHHTQQRLQVKGLHAKKPMQRLSKRAHRQKGQQGKGKDQRMIKGFIEKGVVGRLITHLVCHLCQSLCYWCFPCCLIQWEGEQGAVWYNMGGRVLIGGVESVNNK